MADASFYDTPTIASRKKQTIVTKYFGGWSNIVLPKARAKEGELWYVDLYCGPGKYRDGTESIPLLILRHAINTPALHDTLRVVLNDENPMFTKELEANLRDLPGLHLLRHQPVIRNHPVAKDLIPRLRRINAPTLYLADPWGYEGVSIDLIQAALHYWGNDFLFFFNYNRINMHLTSEVMQGPIDEFFSPERATILRQEVARARPAEREQRIVAAMTRAIKDLKANTDKFTYRSTSGTRTTHHLMIVSRHREGISLFKEISAKESSTFDDGVPSLDHNPAADPNQGTLFSPLLDLTDTLLVAFAARTVTAEQVYYEHHPGTTYVRKNYTEALRRLETAGAISIHPGPDDRRSPDSIPPTATITFPPKN